MKDAVPPLVEAVGAGFAYGDRTVLSDVDLELRAGDVLGVLGPNGAGKSTLIRLLLGLAAPTAGQVKLLGRPIESYSRRAVARMAALVPQDAAADFGFSVREVVEMGRTPFLGRFQPPSAVDHAAVDQALAATETEHLADRPVDRLSGGERRRVLLARALAQTPRVLFLDEPT
ncbi:MAG: ABC transporter ATP-binding protein, partial [Planctomycetia bacterium]